MATTPPSKIARIEDDSADDAVIKGQPRSKDSTPASKPVPSQLKDTFSCFCCASSKRGEVVPCDLKRSPEPEPEPELVITQQPQSLQSKAKNNTENIDHAPTPPTVVVAETTDSTDEPTPTTTTDNDQSTVEQQTISDSATPIAETNETTPTIVESTIEEQELPRDDIKGMALSDPIDAVANESEVEPMELQDHAHNDEEQREVNTELIHVVSEATPINETLPWQPPCGDTSINIEVESDKEDNDNDQESMSVDVPVPVPNTEDLNDPVKDNTKLVDTASHIPVPNTEFPTEVEDITDPVQNIEDSIQQTEDSLDPVPNTEDPVQQTEDIPDPAPNTEDPIQQTEDIPDPAEDPLQQTEYIPNPVPKTEDPIQQTEDIPDPVQNIEQQTEDSLDPIPNTEDPVQQTDIPNTEDPVQQTEDSPIPVPDMEETEDSPIPVPDPDIKDDQESLEVTPPVPNPRVPRSQLPSIHSITNARYRLGTSPRSDHSNEDTSFMYLDDEGGFSVYGVFDGHDGNRASIYARDYIKEYFGTKYKALVGSGLNVREILDMIFIDTEDGFFNSMRSTINEKKDIARQLQGLKSYEAYMRYPHLVERLQELEPLTSGGTTAVVTVLMEDTVYVANTGDSRAVLVHQLDDEQGTLIGTQLSEDHTTDNEHELVRLVTLGLSRDQLKRNGRLGSQENTRCIGDYQIKEGYKEVDTISHASEPPGIPTPSVHVQDITNAKYLLLMSDGVYKSIENMYTDPTPSEVMENLMWRLSKAVREGPGPEGVSERMLLEIQQDHLQTYQDKAKVDERSTLAVQCRKRDDMTLLVVYL